MLSDSYFVMSFTKLFTIIDCLLSYLYLKSNQFYQCAILIMWQILL